MFRIRVGVWIRINVDRIVLNIVIHCHSDATELSSSYCKRVRRHLHLLNCSHPARGLYLRNIFCYHQIYFSLPFNRLRVRPVTCKELRRNNGLHMLNTDKCFAANSILLIRIILHLRTKTRLHLLSFRRMTYPLYQTKRTVKGRRRLLMRL